MSKKIKTVDEVSLARAMKTMFKLLENKDEIYLAFSKTNFKILIYTLAVGTIANIALIDILRRTPTLIAETNIVLYAFQLIISGTGVITGLWLFFKGINIVTERGND